jgi:hypothetical protein
VVSADQLDEVLRHGAVAMMAVGVVRLQVFRWIGR